MGEKRERSGRHGFCVWTEVSAYVPARGASNGTFRRSGSRNGHVLVCSGRVMELNEKKKKGLSAVLPGDSPKQLREDVTQGEGQSASLSRLLITKEDKNKVINNWNKAVDFACGKLINTL